MKSISFRGCGTALITPFRDGNVDYDAFVALLKRQTDAGIHFLVPLGTTGETPCLDEQERIKLLELTREHCGGRKVIAGGGTNSLAQTVRSIKLLEPHGADAFLIVVPYYNKLRDLLSLVKDIEIVEPERRDECCGFGGMFAVEEDAVSLEMGRSKVRRHIDTGAEYIVGADSSCLMHQEGIIRREHLPIKTIHIIEILSAGL